MTDYILWWIGAILGLIAILSGLAINIFLVIGFVVFLLICSFFS